MEILAKIGYFGLFALVIVTGALCFRIGQRTDNESRPLSPVLNALHLFILGLVFVQGYQVFSLIINPLTETWWIPLVCKQSSLWAYIIILKFIEWRLDDSCTNPNSKCTCDKYI